MHLSMRSLHELLELSLLLFVEDCSDLVVGPVPKWPQLGQTKRNVTEEMRPIKFLDPDAYSGATRTNGRPLGITRGKLLIAKRLYQPAGSAKKYQERHGFSLQSRILCLGCSQDWDVRVSFFPERKEIVISRSCLGLISGLFISNKGAGSRPSRFCWRTWRSPPRRYRDRRAFFAYPPSLQGTGDRPGPDP